MQKFTLLASLVFCLVSALFLAWEVPASGQNNGSNNNVVASLPADANSKIAVDRDYKLTVSEIQKLYRQSTDGMSPDNTVTQNPATIMYSRGPVVPLSALRLSTQMQNMLSTGVPTQGLPLTDTAFKAQLLQTQQQLLSQISDPVKNIPRELAQQLATQTMLGNSAAQVATAQANSAINYAGKYLINFTVNEGNVWNRLRNNIFVPIAILLLVPGTILTQTKSLMSAGNPVIEYTNPFEGILRAVIAMCFIPGSYLVVNYGIDFSNSISHTIQDAYRAQFGSDMYVDAFLAEQRAFPSRQLAENQNGLSGLLFLTGATAVGGNQVSGFAQLENELIKNKSFAADGTQVATTGLVDEVLPANAVAARMAVFGTNMLVTSIWDLLCAFQLIYLHYLFLVGPIMAAIWVYPIKQLREAWPNWVAGTITLCFWSLFWNTAILLMALFKDADSTGTFIMTALNLLATGSVKYAFDFVGLITEAGQEAAKTARQNSNQTNNLTNPAGATTEKTKTQNTETKGEGGGGLLGGIAKIATTSLLTAAAPGAAQALSLGSQLLGGIGGSKDGDSAGGLGDFAKSLSLPPLVSSVAESAFPASAAAFGIIGAAGLLGKEEVPLPPLAGGAKAGGAIGALASAGSVLEEIIPSKSKKKSGGLGIETVLGGIEDVVESAEIISGGVGGKTGLGSLTAASALTGPGVLAGMAISAGAESGLDALTGAAETDKSAVTLGANGLLGIAGAGRAAGASRFVGTSKDSRSIGSAGATNAAKSILTASMGATPVGSPFAPAGGCNENEVNTFMSIMAEAAGGSGAIGHGATTDIDVNNCESVAMFGGAVAAITEVGPPPSARISSHGHAGTPSAPPTRTDNLFKQGARSLETTSARELTASGPSQSNTVNLFREHSECEAVDAFSRSQLNFASAPPVASNSTSSYGGPPPIAPAFAKLASSEAEYVAAPGELVGFAEAAAPETASSKVEHFNAGSANYLRAATINNTIADSVFAQDNSVDNATFEDTTSSGSSTENTMFFAAAAAIDYTVAALPPHVESATESNTHVSDTSAAETYVSDTQINPNYNLYMRPSRPDQNENTTGVLSYLDVQSMPESPRPKTLQELMKPSAFERPCDTCKNLTCHCVFATPPTVGAWS